MQPLQPRVDRIDGQMGFGLGQKLRRREARGRRPEELSPDEWLALWKEVRARW